MAFEPNKERRYGSVEQVVSDLFKECGGVPEVVSILELSRTRVYALSDPNDPAQISFDRVAKLTASKKATAAAEHLCALAGGTFLPVEVSEGECWFDSAGETAKKSSALVAELLDAISPSSKSPGEIDPGEARTLLNQVDELMRLLATQRALLAEVVGDASQKPATRKTI